MRVLFFALVALAVAASATPAAQDLIARLHKAQTSKDFDGIANLYADNAVLSVNGNKTEGRAAIKTYYTALLTPLLVQSFQTNSPIYSTAANVFHFAQQGFYSKEDATLGECLAVVHSLERIATDASGKIIFQRSEWEETKKQFDDDLKCEHHEDHHKHEAIQDRIVERTFERHRQVEGLEFNRFLKGFQANASLVTGLKADGTAAESQEGIDAIRAFYHPLFNKSSSIAFSPCSPVYIRDKNTFSVSSLFVVTHTGCSYSAQVIFYNSFTDKANITSSEQLFVAPASYAGLLDVLAQDCGRKKAEGVGRKVNDLGEGEDDSAETIEEDDEEEDDLEDYHDDL